MDSSEEKRIKRMKHKGTLFILAALVFATGIVLALTGNDLTIGDVSALSVTGYLLLSTGFFIKT